MERSPTERDLPRQVWAEDVMATVVASPGIRRVERLPTRSTDTGRWLGPALVLSLGLWAVIGLGAVAVTHLV
jgi:hypothetical protein